MTNGNVRVTKHCVRPLRLIVGMGIRQVSHCQAQPGVPKTRGIGSSDHIKQAPAESCGQHGRKSTKSIANQPSRVVKSSTSRRSRSSRSTKQPSRSLRSTQSTTRSTVQAGAYSTKTLSLSSSSSSSSSSSCLFQAAWPIKATIQYTNIQ